MLQVVINRNTYQDSVSLMLLSSTLSELDEVDRVSIMMGTPANKDIFRSTGFDVPGLDDATPGDLVIAIDATYAGAAELVERKAAEFFANQSTASNGSALRTVRSLDRALAAMPEANLALLSIPGEYVTAEAHRMLDHGLHTFIFSDNVTLEDELALKTRGKELGLLVMGPDCGTGMISGIPLAFTNVTAKGSIGIVGASGTGMQEVMAQIDRLGGGVSHAIGLGGRDLSETIGAITATQALHALDADPETSVIVLVSKPPAPAVRERIDAELSLLTKPVVVMLLGAQPEPPLRGNVRFSDTLAETARKAVELAGSATSARVRLTGSSRRLRGLFCGGTLANEAAMLVSKALGIPENADHVAGFMIRYDGHEIVDLGDDAYTVGRAHPMIDPSLRSQMIAKALADPEVGVLLLDIVLGHGSHMDPAGAIAPAISEGLAAAREAGRQVAVVASVCGTERDPQGLREQERKVIEAGATVLPNNAAAVAHALYLLASADEPVRQPATVPATISALLSGPPAVINVGLKGFATTLLEAGAPTVQYDWQPLASGDARMIQLLAALS